MLANMYSVKRPRKHPGTASIPKGKGVGVPSNTHCSNSPSRQPPESVLIQFEAAIATTMRKKENKHNRNATTFIGLGFEVVVILVDIV